MEKYWQIGFLLTLSLLTRFLFLNYPSEVVFDEVYFGNFASAYFNHRYYFDIHPPLGKLTIAGVAKILGYKGGFNFQKIGQEVDPKILFSLRFLPALFGSLLPVLIYEFVLILGYSRRAAFLAGFLFVFENSLLVQSKFILLDSFLIFFGFLALYFYFLAKKSGGPKRKFFCYSFSAVFAAFSFSIKWTGLSFLGIILALLFFDFLKAKKKVEVLKVIFLFVLLPFLVYFSVFAIHFSLLKKSGPGDAFMSEAFQKTLIGNKISRQIKPLSLWQKFTELNLVMLKSNASLKTPHPYSSRYFEWLYMKKPIWYWTKSLDSKEANIYFYGNFLTWILSSLGIFLSAFLPIFKRRPLPKILFFGYFLNLLPFCFIKRVTFLYSYLPAYCFAILNFSILAESFLKKRGYFLLLLFIFLTFLLISPLSYGLYLKKETVEFYRSLLF
jgi:dolichyl-phosphate-mannose-protein mannosyltransferase